MIKIVKNPGNGCLNNLNDPVLNVLNKINIHNTSRVLTCESLLLTCIKFCVKMKGTQHKTEPPVFNVRPLQAI